MTDEKSIGTVIQKKVKHVSAFRVTNYPDPYIVYGIYCERELIWMYEYELERIEV